MASLTALVGDEEETPIGRLAFPGDGEELAFPAFRNPSRAASFCWNIVGDYTRIMRS